MSEKTAAMFAGFITKTAPKELLMGEIEATDDSGATASLEPGTLPVLLPGKDVKFSTPADVGCGYAAFQYRTLLSVSASLGLFYHLVTGDVRQVNYPSLRAELVECRRRACGGVEAAQYGGSGTTGRVAARGRHARAAGAADAHVPVSGWLDPAGTCGPVERATIGVCAGGRTPSHAGQRVVIVDFSDGRGPENADRHLSIPALESSTNAICRRSDGRAR